MSESAGTPPHAPVPPSTPAPGYPVPGLGAPGLGVPAPGAPRVGAPELGAPGFGAPADPDAEHGEPPPAGPSPRVLVGSISGFATVLGLALLAVLPAPYVASAPGPTFDTLGSNRNGSLIEISGTETFPSTGELRLTTVSFFGGPGRDMDLLRVLAGWISPATVVAPVEMYFSPDETREDVSQNSQQQMTTSQEDATVAALSELGIEVPVTITVVDVIEGTGAEGLLEAEDQIVSLDGDPLREYRDLTTYLTAVEPGATVQVGVLRAGEPVQVDILTGESPDGGALLGVWIDPEFDFPFRVEIRVDDVGGPSAGSIFALGIMDLLTPEDEANGQVIAGTGAIRPDGQIRPIAGVRQKLVGASRDSATWFLAPVANCDEVVGNVPSGLQVVAVATLAEAWDAVTRIGSGDTDGLAGC